MQHQLLPGLRGAKLNPNLDLDIWRRPAGVSMLAPGTLREEAGTSAHAWASWVLLQYRMLAGSSRQFKRDCVQRLKEVCHDFLMSLAQCSCQAQDAAAASLAAAAPGSGGSSCMCRRGCPRSDPRGRCRTASVTSGTGRRTCCTPSAQLSSKPAQSAQAVVPMD